MKNIYFLQLVISALLTCPYLCAMDENNKITYSQGKDGQPIDDLCLECLKKDKKKVEELVQKGVDINGLNTVFINETKNVEEKEKVKSFKPTIILRSKQLTPLICAVTANSSEIMNFLLGNEKIVINQQNGYSGAAALHYAVQRKSEECTKILLDHGAAVNMPDNSGNTPLHWSNLQNIPLLLTCGADMNMVNNDGLSSLYSAAQRHAHCFDFEVEKRDACFSKIVTYLLESGAFIDGFNKKEQCPNLYLLKNNGKTSNEWASKFLVQGEMSKPTPSEQIPDYLNSNVRPQYIKFLAKYKTVFKATESLQRLFEAFEMEQKDRKAIISEYVHEEARSQSYDRVACYYGPEWEFMSNVDQMVEVDKTVDKRKEYVHELVLKKLAAD